MQQQIATMREYYKAFIKQDKRIKDYEKYFPSLLCYLEGSRRA